MSISMSEMAEALSKMNDRLLQAEAQNLVAKNMLYKLATAHFALNEELKVVWEEGLAADKKTWTEALDTAKSESTRKFMQAGIEAIDSYRADTPPDGPQFVVIQGGKD